MTRRQLLATLFGVATTHKSIHATNHERAGFQVSGHLTNAGQENERYYAIDQSVALMLDARKHPAMVQGADALLGQRVRLVLEPA